jgi:hypothetical protein
MKNLVKSISLLMLVMLISCKKEVVAQNSDCVIDETIAAQSDSLKDTRELEADKDEPETARVCDLPEALSDKDITMEISAHLRNFTEKQEIKMREALRRLKIIINSKEFKEKVINHKYQDKYTFIDNDDLSNEQIYDKLIEGAEELDPTVDHEVDLDFTMYYKRNNTVGYTYPSTNRIWVNSRFFTSASYGKVAANAIHEWSHKVGFGHSYKYNSRRPFSVPYGVGTIIRELVDSM